MTSYLIILNIKWRDSIYKTFQTFGPAEYNLTLPRRIDNHIV
jgi:hypothetical protein